MLLLGITKWDPLAKMVQLKSWDNCLASLSKSIKECIKLAAALQDSWNSEQKIIKTKSNIGRNIKAIFLLCQRRPAAIKVFSAKTWSQLLFGAQLGLYRLFLPLERVQFKFQRTIFQTPPFNLFQTQSFTMKLVSKLKHLPGVTSCPLA